MPRSSFGFNSTGEEYCHLGMTMEYDSWICYFWKDVAIDFMMKRREAGNDLGGGLFMRWDGGGVEGFRAGHVTRLVHINAPRRSAGVSLVKTRVVSEHLVRSKSYSK